MFLSQESSADVVQEALSMGAEGYVVKTGAASDLLPALEAVRHGKRFVSSGLLGNHFTEPTDALAPRPPVKQQAVRQS